VTTVSVESWATQNQIGQVFWVRADRQLRPRDRFRVIVWASRQVTALGLTAGYVNVVDPLPPVERDPLTFRTYHGDGSWEWGSGSRPGQVRVPCGYKAEILGSA
jgi:hypothetical protein